MWISSWHLGKTGVCPQEILRSFTLLLVNFQECVVLSYYTCQNASQAILIILCIRKPAEIPQVNSTSMKVIITFNINTKWKAYHQLLVIHLKMNDRKAQLKELACCNMCKTLFPNLSKIRRWNLSLNPCHVSFSFTCSKCIC